MDETIEPVIEALGAWLPVAGFALLGGLGLLLLLLGRTLVKLACILSGVVLGVLAGLLVGEMLQEHGAVTIALVIGAALAGGLLAWVTFRIWMGLSAALVLAVAVPAGALIWSGMTGEVEADDPADAPSPEQIEEELAEAEDPLERLRDWLGLELEEEQAASFGLNDVDPAQLSAEQIEELIEQAGEAVRSWYGQQADRVRDWWGGLDGGTQRMLMTGALVGAGLGLLLGLVMPYLMASFESALAGAVLVFVAGRELLTRLAPGAAEWLPQAAPTALALIGLITLLGFVLQWMIFAPRADRK